MTPEQWRRISAIFAAARVLSGTDREAFLHAVCTSHPEDRPELDSLLAQHASGDSAVDLPRPAAVPAEPFEIGQQVGHYRVVRRLKPGGMGMLYVAEDNLRREVVLKVLAPEWAEDVRQQSRLRQEAEAMARLQHPNIAAVYAFDEHGGVPFLVSEFVRGRDLRERLEAEGPYDPDSLIEFGLAVAEALGVAHGAGIVHRDLKPENIMLPETGGVKLVDFGIARIESADQPTRTTLTKSGALVGTPAYMTPEQLQGLRVDHRCDLFALGIVLYEAGTGAHPFAGRTRATTLINILQLEPPPLGSRRPLAFGAIEAIVARCLRKQPEQRYASALDLMTDLRAARATLTHGVAAAATRPAPSPGPRWWFKFHQVIVSLVYGLLLIPLWLAHERLLPGSTRDALFFSGLSLAVVSILARLNAAFLAGNWPETFAARWRTTQRLVAILDSLLALVFLWGATLVREGKPGLAAVLVAGAVGTIVTLLLIEPPTTRAALGD